MRNIFYEWYQRNFSNPQAVVLLMLLIIGFASVILLGRILAPIFGAIVIAYLLDWLVHGLCQRAKLPRTPAVAIVVTSFFTLLTVVVIGLLPSIGTQLNELYESRKAIVDSWKELLAALPQKYPDLISAEQIERITNKISTEFGELVQTVLSVSLTSLMGLAELLVYLILVPLLVIFMLKDKTILLDWFIQRLPKERGLASNVWREVNAQIGNYIRGKVVEIIIVGSVSFAVFAYMQLNYAILLAAMVGFSVLIPYIGAAVVTIPVALIGYFQWGWSADFGYLMLAYAIIQALDGNVLVPILFSEAVNLHPVAIILAVLLFGGIWGFWGVFFAIPLATLFKAVLNAWDGLHA